MQEDSEPKVDPRSMPLLAGPTVGEVQDIIEAALDQVVWTDGLEHMTSIRDSLVRIADNLEKLTGELVQAEREAIADTVARKLLETELPQTNSLHVPDPHHPGKFINVIP